ncbi:hypothetical protein HY634_00070 [Candidatus Uhrbacteria bacterium]|nr:hypothetical protein [Candidatus Uhrbacteria bacterium]
MTYDERDRFTSMTELVEREIVKHHDAIVVVELRHVPCDGGPFTSVELKDASGRILADHDRTGFPTLEAYRLLQRHFEHVLMEDQGIRVHFTVSGPPPTPTPGR